MKSVTVLFSGAVFALAVFAASSDQFAEERYRAKYGRYTPTEEARRDALAAVVQAKHVVESASQACCRHMPRAAASSPRSSANEAWFHAKFGRNTPAYEAREKAAKVQMAAAHAEKCAELSRCPKPVALVSQAGENSKTAAAGSFTDTEAIPTASNEQALHAAAGHSACVEACCKRGE